MKKSITKILSAIFHTIGVSNKRDQKFWITLFEVLLHMRGRKNYTNIARYGPFSELTLRRRMNKPFEWLKFNIAMFEYSRRGDQNPVIGAFDCSFIRKSGSKTYGLDKFWSSVAGKSLKGLEISLIAVIEVIGAKAWAIDIKQTPAELSGKDSADEANRLDIYLAQLNRSITHLPKVTYWVADSFYAKLKVFKCLGDHSRFLITQLRNDANLRYLHPEIKPGKPGPKPKWGAKVDFADLSRWESLGRDFKLAHLNLYTMQLYSPQFERKLRVVMVKNARTGQYLLLASSDFDQDPRQVVAYYQLRFQIEFLIRDAKQFAGLEHAQTRKEQNLDNHFNLSMALVNLMNALQIELSHLTSKNSLIRVAFNTNLIQAIIHKLGLKPEFVNSKGQIDHYYNYGAFAT